MAPDARAAYAAFRADPDLVYLDSAATTLLHDDVRAVVLDALEAGGSAGRGGHRRAHAATEALEGARAAVAAHLGVEAADTVFVASATAGLNLLAHGWGGQALLPGDTVLVSQLEHHSHRLPWAHVARETGARVQIVRCTPEGGLDRDHLGALLHHQPRVLALTHVSNVTGALVPLADVVAQVRARSPHTRVVVDGTQAVPHRPVAPEALGVDAYVFSGHKAYGPLGAGVVWARSDLWAETTPVAWGGGMVSGVDTDGPHLAERPWRFEGGTPNHPAILGLAAGLRFCGVDHGLADRAAQRLAEQPGCRLVGTPPERVGLVSFVVEGRHPHDVATDLDRRGIAVRVGHLCAQPLLDALGVRAVVRASFGRYSREADLDALVAALSDGGAP